MKKLICLIESDIQLAQTMKKKLSQNGFTVFHYTSGDDYLGDHAAGLNALYLIGLNLPHISGEDLIRSIRKASSIVPIFVISSEIEHKEMIQVLKAGADDFLTKPFDMEEFMMRITVAWNKYILYLNR